MSEYNQTARYFRKGEVAQRYDMTTRNLNRLLQHPDPARRFPPPSLVLENTPVWSESDLDNFDAEQTELSKHRKVRRLDDPYISIYGQPPRKKRRRRTPVAAAENPKDGKPG